MDWAQILLIALAIILAVFLILALSLMIVIIRLTYQIKTTASSAQRTAATLRSSASKANKVVAPIHKLRQTIKHKIARRQYDKEG